MNNVFIFIFMKASLLFPISTVHFSWQLSLSLIQLTSFPLKVTTLPVKVELPIDFYGTTSQFVYGLSKEYRSNINSLVWVQFKMLHIPFNLNKCANYITFEMQYKKSHAQIQYNNVVVWICNPHSLKGLYSCIILKICAIPAVKHSPVSERKSFFYFLFKHDTCLCCLCSVVHQLGVWWESLILPLVDFIAYHIWN